MLRRRLLFGPILIALLVGLIWLDQWVEHVGYREGVVLVPVVLIVSILAGIELANVIKALGIEASQSVTCAATVLGVAVASLTGSDLKPGILHQVSGVAVVCTASSLVLLLSMIVYSRHHSAKGVIVASSTMLLAFVYLGLMGGFALVLRFEYDGWMLLGVVLITKSCDIGAYFVGTAIGRHKLIPWLSPGKSWEGLVGGLVVAAMVSVGATKLPGLERYGLAGLAIWQAALIGGVLGLLGQAGDLIASMLKRDAGLKDSSRMLPGFGGLLDVIDSPLLVIPAAYWLLEVLTNGPSPAGI